jgi:hypothetical protein
LSLGSSNRGYVSGLFATFLAAFISVAIALFSRSTLVRLTLVTLAAGFLACGVLSVWDLIRSGAADSQMDKTFMRRRSAFWLYSAGIAESAILVAVFVAMFNQPFPGPNTARFVGTAWRVEISPQPNPRYLRLWAEGRTPSLLTLQCSRSLAPCRYSEIWRRAPPLQTEVPVELLTSGRDLVSAKVNGVMLVDADQERVHNRRIAVLGLSLSLLGVTVCVAWTWRLKRLLWP